MSNSLPTINLIRNKQAPLLDRFMNWALTIGRLIVIITEVVAVIAFIYRFSLDEKLVELHSAIKQKQNIISVLKNDENKYRNLQERLAIAARFSETSIKSNQIIADITSLMPNQVRISNLNLNKDRINIGADVTSVPPLAEFIDLLRNYHGIKSISVDNIENKPSVGLSVDISALLK